MSNDQTYQAVLASLLVQLAEDAGQAVPEFNTIEGLKLEVRSAAEQIRAADRGLADPLRQALDRVEGLDWTGYPALEVEAGIRRARRLVSGTNSVLDPVL